MSEHPLSAITKSHIAIALRSVSSRGRNSWIYTDKRIGLIEFVPRNEETWSAPSIFVEIEDEELGMKYRFEMELKDRHLEENILKEGEIRLTKNAIELISDIWFKKIEAVLKEE